MKKKLLSVLLSAAMLAAVLAGCGSSAPAPAESTGNDFVPPRQVIRETTEAVPQQMAVSQEKTKEKSPAVTESPWSHMKPEPKRKKHFTQSPWSHQGGKSE